MSQDTLMQRLFNFRYHLPGHTSVQIDVSSTSPMQGFPPCSGRGLVQVLVLVLNLLHLPSVIAQVLQGLQLDQDP